ncbi:MAG: hypothetical protein KJ597_05925, partial [Nanoarchaeota archaeon]|nr:hypothetical protein [Nanoarchaeota archaeon]
MICLFDLPNHYKINFNKKANPILIDILNNVRSYKGLDTINRRFNVNFYLLEDFLNGNSSSLTIGTIKKFFMQYPDFPRD